MGQTDAKALEILFTNLPSIIAALTGGASFIASAIVSMRTTRENNKHAEKMFLMKEQVSHKNVVFNDFIKYANAALLQDMITFTPEDYLSYIRCINSCITHISFHDTRKTFTELRDTALLARSVADIEGATRMVFSDSYEHINCILKAIDCLSVELSSLQYAVPNEPKIRIRAQGKRRKNPVNP